MSVSELQKQYVKKHQKEKTDTVTVRPQKGTKDMWRKAANSLGLSLQRFVIDSVNKAACVALETKANSEDL